MYRARERLSRNAVVNACGACILRQGFDYQGQNDRSSKMSLRSGALTSSDDSIKIHRIESDTEVNISARSHLPGVLPAILGEEGWVRAARKHPPKLPASGFPAASYRGYGTEGSSAKGTRPDWLPHEYMLTPGKMTRLKARLAEVTRSDSIYQAHVTTVRLLRIYHSVCEYAGPGMT